MTELEYINLMKEFGCVPYCVGSTDYGLFVTDKVEWLFGYRRTASNCRPAANLKTVTWEPGSFCVYDIDKTEQTYYRRIQNRHTTDVNEARKYIMEVISEIKLMKMKKLIKDMEKDFE